MPNEETQSEPSVVTALGRAIDAGQRIVVNRIDLARLDMLDVVSRVTRGGMLVVFGGVLLGVGWLAFTSAAILYGQNYLTLPGSAALVGAINAALGGIILAVGIQRVRPAPNTNGGDKR
jgi:hypothetical protein